MNNEENFLRQYLGTDHHFKVPDNYFEQLPAKIMEHLPERSPILPSTNEVHRDWFHVIIGVAASLIAVLCLSIGWYFGGHSKNIATSTHSVAHTVYNDDLDELTNYSMLDNEDMYAYVSSVDK